MNVPRLVARVLLGLTFVVFGLNGFFNFINPPPLGSKAQSFIDIMMSTDYLHVVKAIEIVGGSLLLIGVFVPLGITLLTPVVVNIFLFHFFLDGQTGSLIFAGVLLALNVYLIASYWSVFRPLTEAGDP